MATNSIVVALDAQTSKYERKIKGADKKTEHFTKTGIQAETAQKKFNLSMIASAVSVGLLTSKLITLTDSYTTIQNKLRIVTKNQTELNNVTNELFDIANRSRSSIEATVTLYARLARNTKDLKISQEELLKVTESINKAFIVGGATTQEATSAVIQLSQAFASGRLAGDEFRSVSEGAPVILEAITYATGATRGELKKLASQGKLTSKVVIESIQVYKDKIDGDFSKANKTFSNSITEANNNLTKFIGELGASDALQYFGQNIVTLSENFDTFATVLTGGLFIAALANVKKLEVLLRANPYLLAATSLAMLTNAMFSYAKANLNEKIFNINKAKTYNEQIKETKKNIDELKAKGIELTTAQHSIVSLFLSDEQKAQNEKEISTLKLQIATQVDLLQKLESLKTKKGGDAIFSTGINNNTPKTKSNDNGKGSVSLTPLDFLKEQNQGDLKLRYQHLEDVKSINQQMLQASEDFRLAVEEINITGEETAQELLNKEVEIHKAALDQKFINIEQFNKRSAESAEKFAKSKKKTNKGEEISDNSKFDNAQTGIRAGMALNTLLFEDNKAINAGLIIADTAVGIQRALTPSLPGMPPNFAAAALIAATGAVNLSNALSASKGGGTIGGVGGGEAQQQNTFTPDTSSLDLTTQTDSTNQTIKVIFATDDGNDFFDMVGQNIQDASAQGRI